MKNRTNFIEEIRYTMSIKAISIYIGLVMLMILTASLTGSLVYAFGMLMSGMTFVTLKFIPNDRENTIKVFKATMGGYFLWMLMLYVLLSTATATSQFLQVEGFLMSVFSFTTFMIPIGYIIWQAQKFRFLVGIGRSKKETIDYIKDHSNDGLN